MNTISKKILAIIFILLIFFIGLGTSLRMMDGMDQVREQEGVQDTKAALDSLITDSFMNKTDWVSINGLFQRLLGVTIVRDEDKDVYKLSNGQIMYNLPERDMTKYAGYVADLDKALKEEDIELLYVQIPYKIKYDSYMPPRDPRAGQRERGPAGEAAPGEGRGHPGPERRDRRPKAGLDLAVLRYGPSLDPPRPPSGRRM